MCGCRGNNQRRALTVTTKSNGDAAVQRQPAAGMPHYVVIGSAKGDREFVWYNEARVWKATYGGTLRAV